MGLRRTTKMNKLTRQAAVLMVLFVGLAECKTFEDRSSEVSLEARNIGDTYKTSEPLSRSKRHSTGAFEKGKFLSYATTKTCGVT